MTGIRFTDVQSRPTEFLDLTSLTLDEFQQLAPPFEAAFQAHMAAWRLDGKPQTARRFSVYTTRPLPTPEDRLFFLLTSLKTYNLQVVQGHLFGLSQSKANRWVHVLLPALHAALPRRYPGSFPCDSGVTAWRHGGRRGCGDDAAGGGACPHGRCSRHRGTAVPPFAHDARNGASSAPRTLLNRRTVIAARKDHTVKNVLLVNAPLTILFLSATYGGRTHDKRIAEATPYPLPAGSRLLQDLGFLAFTLPQVEIGMPTKKPRGQDLTLEQRVANRAL
jgi:hypothetical protein